MESMGGSVAIINSCDLFMVEARLMAAVLLSTGGGSLGGGGVMLHTSGSCCRLIDVLSLAQGVSCLLWLRLC